MEKIQKTFKFRLEPTKAQQVLLSKFAGCARFVFNYGLSIFKEAFENKNKLPSYTDIANKLPKLKKSEDTAWLAEVHSQILQQSLKDLESAIKHFFRRIKEKKEKPGFPKFKKKGMHDAFRYPQGIKCANGKVFLPKVGQVPYRDSRPIDGVIKQATIKREGKHWFIAIVCEVEHAIQRVPISQERAIGIDLGLLNFAHLSNGEEIENPRWFRSELACLAKAQRNLCRKKKGSNNRKKAAEKVGKIHRRITNKRHDFLHKQSTTIVKNHDVVAVEDLNVSGMIKNRHLALSIADVGWKTFLAFLEYKSNWMGKHFVSIDRFEPTSKTCSMCGNKQDMPLKIRTFVCSFCNMQMDRDLNASINIRSAGLAVLNACGG